MQTIDTKQMSLHEKMLKIAEMAGVLRKTKEGFGYKYVPEEDIQAKVTAGMLKYHVMLYTYIVPGTLNVVPIHYEKMNKKNELVPVNEVLVYADTVYKWVDVDNPQNVVETPWAFVGQMEDASQAFGSGTTYSNRYYLMKQLQLATTEADPDNYRSKQKAADKELGYEEAKALEEEIAKIVAVGKELIAAGTSKEVVSGIVAKNNNGNGNPNCIESLENAKAILETLKAANKKTASETTRVTKEKKQ